MVDSVSIYYKKKRLPSREVAFHVIKLITLKLFCTFFPWKVQIIYTIEAPQKVVFDISPDNLRSEIESKSSSSLKTSFL